MSDRVPSGVRRLDELLGGGLPARSSVLVYGPPFVGKETFARVFLLEGLRRRTPAVLVLTDASAADVRAGLLAMDPTYAAAEAAGLVHYIDAYSRTIGAQETVPNTEYVDGVINFNGVTAALNNVQRRIIRDHASHRLVFESVSTLMAYTNAQTTFRFLQVLLGRARSGGATSLLLLGRGMHAETDVQTVKHLTSGLIEFTTEAGRNLMRIEGIGLTEPSNWVDYRFGPAQLEITGSFKSGRIR